MASTYSKITVVPPVADGVGVVPVAVSIKAPNGLTATAYTSRDGSTAFTFPATITVETTFYLTSAGDHEVSAIAGAQQVATQAGKPAQVYAPNSSTDVVVRCVDPVDNADSLAETIATDTAFTSQFVADRNGATITGISGTLSAFTDGVRLAWNEGLTGHIRDGSTVHWTIGRASLPAVDGGNQDHIYIGDMRDDCVSFLAPIDVGSGFVIDFAQAGNYYANIDTWIVQAFPGDLSSIRQPNADVDPGDVGAIAKALKLKFGTRSDQGVITSRMSVNNGESAANTWWDIENSGMRLTGTSSTWDIYLHRSGGIGVGTFTAAPSNAIHTRVANSGGVRLETIAGTAGWDLMANSNGNFSIDLAGVADAVTIDKTNWHVRTRGALSTLRTSAPADAYLSAGQLAMWFDSTNGASKAMFKGKSANGTVVSGSVTLS